LYYGVKLVIKIFLALKVCLGIPIFSSMDAEAKSKKSGAKQSFNLEPDVERLVRRWSAQNPMVIKSRMFNAALRIYLPRYVARNGKLKVAA